VPEEKLRVGCVLSGLIEIGLSPMPEHEHHMQLDPQDLISVSKATITPAQVSLASRLSESGTKVTSVPPPSSHALSSRQLFNMIDAGNLHTRNRKPRSQS